MTSEQHACSISACPRTAEAFEEGEVSSWIVRLHFCHEHSRERDKGTPMGGLGIDGTRVEFIAKETSEPQTGGDMHAVGPQ